MSYIRIIGERPANTLTCLLYHEVPDGVSRILDPVAVIVQHADGREERVAIQDVGVAEGQLSTGVDKGSSGHGTG